MWERKITEPFKVQRPNTKEQNSGNNLYRSKQP